MNIYIQDKQNQTIFTINVDVPLDNLYVSVSNLENNNVSYSSQWKTTLSTTKSTTSNLVNSTFSLKLRKQKALPLILCSYTGTRSSKCVSLGTWIRSPFLISHSRPRYSHGSTKTWQIASAAWSLTSMTNSPFWISDLTIILLHWSGYLVTISKTPCPILNRETLTHSASLFKNSMTTYSIK